MLAGCGVSPNSMLGPICSPSEFLAMAREGRRQDEGCRTCAQLLTSHCCCSTRSSGTRICRCNCKTLDVLHKTSREVVPHPEEEASVLNTWLTTLTGNTMTSAVAGRSEKRGGAGRIRSLCWCKASQFDHIPLRPLYTAAVGRVRRPALFTVCERQ